MLEKIKEWSSRYVGAEILGTIGALSGTIVSTSIPGEPALVLTAYLATLGENLGFYGWMIHKEHSSLPEDKRDLHSIWKLSHIGRSLFMEFGIAEMMDSLLLRPACMYGAILLTNDPISGTVIGKFAADITFYLPAIACYELKKWWWSRKNGLD
ncbi:MAG TPA: hypothetical protein PKA63_07715 [Oligoflexia bacterium]|nr:hypothetical protein [Oligoflexia bacterium]HMP48536.1 hypothetical protein [Oligoflexia bacterium]